MLFEIKSLVNYPNRVIYKGVSYTFKANEVKELDIDLSLIYPSFLKCLNTTVQNIEVVLDNTFVMTELDTSKQVDVLDIKPDIGEIPESTDVVGEETQEKKTKKQKQKV